MLSQPLLEELKMILKEDFGQSIEDQEVDEIGMAFVGYFDALNNLYRKINMETKNEKNLKP